MRGFIVIIVLTLQACATPSLPQTGPPAGAKALQLPAQALADGECGLFIWSADAARRFVLFAQSQEFTALWQDAGQQRTLTIAEQDGIPAQGQFPIQIYNNGMTLRLSKAQTIGEGTRYQGGTLSAKDAQGWESVTPVIGVSTCR